MRIYFDTEFIEDGRTIDLLSIGMVREDGTEYYAVVSDAPWDRVQEHRWLSLNVWPHMPLRGHKEGLVTVGGKTEVRLTTMGNIDTRVACVKPKWVIANEVRDFAGQAPEWWAWYADYDWVVLCQLFGTMMRMPEGWPMYCRDFKQVVDDHALTPPSQDAQDGPEHHALSDARWLARVATPHHKGKR